jgi:hypothetical protein
MSINDMFGFFDSLSISSEMWLGLRLILDFFNYISSLSEDFSDRY